MRTEKRRNRRRSIDGRAWVDQADGSPLMVCSIGNMSDTGAKLVFSEPPQLPDQFILQLSSDGRVARKCRLAWVNGNTIGVQFIAKLIAGRTKAMESLD
jgi:hypothetical protein